MATATATAVIDTAALVRSATWGGDIVRKAIVAHLDAAASELRAERDGYMESGDAMGDHMHIACVVENVERLRDEIATASLVPPQWLDAPTCDGLWWCYVPGSGEAPTIARMTDGSVSFVGTGFVAMAADMPPRRWLRVDVPEAPR